MRSNRWSLNVGNCHHTLSNNPEEHGFLPKHSLLAFSLNVTIIVLKSLSGHPVHTWCALYLSDTWWRSVTGYYENGNERLAAQTIINSWAIISLSRILFCGHFNIIRHQLGLERPISASSNSLLKGFASHISLIWSINNLPLRTTRFNIQKFYIALALRWVFGTDIRTDSDFCFIQHWLIGLYNRCGKCWLCGTDWVFTYSRLRFVFKRSSIIFGTFIKFSKTKFYLINSSTQ